MKPFDRSIKIAPSILSADFANFGAECRRPIHIEVDGGVTPETAPLVAAAGADVLVVRADRWRRRNLRPQHRGHSRCGYGRAFAEVA